MCDESPWSFARGTGWNTYLQGGTGTYGQGFLNLLYHLNSKLQAGVAVQFGSSFTQATLELDYDIKNFYVGIQAGPTWYHSSTGFGIGTMLGADFSISKHFSLGGVVVYQTISWPSGVDDTTTTMQTVFSPFFVITYDF